VKRFLTCLLVAGLAISGVIPVGYETYVHGPSVMAAANMASRQATSTTRKPIHQSIFFNDYQVVGLGENGWNWVKNDEFILPPQTPLEIDIVQTTYARTGAINRKRVFLDGTELAEHRSEIKSPSTVLEWKVPRFSIPAGSLAPGKHQLTFVVEDGDNRSSTVNVRFIVEQETGVAVFLGDNANGRSLPSGHTEKILGVSGSRQFFASEEGMWKIVGKNTTNLVKDGFGQSFDTGSLQTGMYDVIFQPRRKDAPEWKISLEVGLPAVYYLLNGNKQQLAQGQKITFANVPGSVSFFADVPGRWSVSGTNQAAVMTQSFQAVIPDILKGMTLTVTYEPEGGEVSSAFHVQIDVPQGDANACDPTKALAKMDILTKANPSSSFTTERERVASSNQTIDVYQEPLHEIWVTTAGTHMKRGGTTDAEEGPGIWAVNNVIADASRLNWDHTALNLASYMAGYYKVKYISKQDPALQWCGTIRVYESKQPSPSSPSCEVGEYGQSPAIIPLRLTTKKGTNLTDGGTIVVSSPSQLAEYSSLSLYANHVVYYGEKKIAKGSKSERRFYIAPDLRWEVEKNEFGEERDFSGGKIFSRNSVKVLYNNKEVLEEITPRSNGRKDSLNLRKIIAENRNKPGKYTVVITHELSYVECRVDRAGKYYEKQLDTITKTQTFTTTIVVK
jgi:hypothetical protein